MIRTFCASIAIVIACVFAVLPLADAQPRRRPKPATQEDIARLEKKIEDQQKVIDRLVKLHQQIVQATAAALDPSEPHAAAEPAATAPSQTAAQPAAPAPGAVKPLEAIAAQPAVAERPRPIRREARLVKVPRPEVDRPAVGTVVGKIVNGANAIVYVETVRAPVRGVTASMRQQGKSFVPSTLVVTSGTRVEFPNRDAIFHNVFSVTPDYAFDLGSYKQGQSKSVTVSKPGVITVYCNMHPQMVGHILVVPNGNYVRAGKDGFFRLTNVPAGSHRIVAWAPNAKAVSVATTVVGNEVATVEMQLKRGAAAPHLKKDGMPYGSYDR